MSERPTPETDAYVAALNDEWDVEFAALTSHAKKLERERNEARERERVAITSWDEERQRAIRESDRVLKAIRERDEAREAFAMATDQLVQAQAALREAREAAAKWEAVALREASINGTKFFGREAAK